jgi:hypothetical protein
MILTEYPELSPEAQAILTAGNWDCDPETRRGIAAALDALDQQMAFMSIVSRRDYIEAIARNLYTPAPRPTLAEAREAARQLGGPSAQVVHQFLANLPEAV